MFQSLQFQGTNDREIQWAMGLQIHEISVMCPTTRHCQQGSLHVCRQGELGEPSYLLCCFALPAIVTLDLHKVPLVSLPCPGISFRVHPLHREKLSIVPALRFADNVLSNPIGRLRKGELWEGEGRWSGFTALFLSLECQ